MIGLPIGRKRVTIVTCEMMMITVHGLGGVGIALCHSVKGTAAGVVVGGRLGYG